MKAYILVAWALVIGLSLPAMAQQSPHRYVAFFNYSEAAVKAMTETPQDRAAQAAELAESFGGKMEAAYWFPAGSDYDGMVIWTFQDVVSEEALGLFARATGNFTRIKSLFADDWRGVQGRDGEGQECEDELHPANINQAITRSKANKKRPPVRGGKQGGLVKETPGMG